MLDRRGRRGAPVIWAQKCLLTEEFVWTKDGKGRDVARLCRHANQDVAFGDEMNGVTRIAFVEDDFTAFELSAARHRLDPLRGFAVQKAEQRGLDVLGGRRRDVSC
jgi:hypothetical protein